MRLTPTPPLLALLHHALALPWASPFTNTTAPTTQTSITNTTLNNPSGGPYTCTHMYPSDLTVVNSRYPTYSTSHLHQSTRLFMLRRQTRNESEIATRVQFSPLPASSLNQTCRLEFLLPHDIDAVQRVSGPNPSFVVYHVDRGPGQVATWETYEGNGGSAEVFGFVNGEQEARERTRRGGGTVSVGQAACEETMTFQMGMAFDAVLTPNYWAFTNVAPPAGPVQGFRVVWGC